MATTKSVTLNHLPVDLVRKMKLRAQAEGKRLSRVYEEAIAAYLEPAK